MRRDSLSALAILIVVVATVTLLAAVTYVSSTEQNTTANTNPRTFVFDIGTRTNGALVVAYAILDVGAARTVTAQDWAGTSLTKIAEVSETTAPNKTCGILYLVNPTNGSQTLTMTLSGASSATTTWIAPLWFDGVFQTQGSVLDQSNTATGTTDPSASITPGTTNTLVVSVYASNADAVLTATEGTMRQNQDFGTETVGVQTKILTTESPQVMSWAGVDNAYCTSVASFKEVVVPPATGGKPLSRLLVR